MQSFLRQATASQARALGPFIDDTDFKTPKTGLTIANTDIKIVVNGAASADKNSGGGTHRVNGVYGATFDATDTATVGEFFVSVVVAGALPVFAAFVVLEEAVYDALYAASAPGYVVDQPVNVTKWLGTTVATPNTAGVPKTDLVLWLGTAPLALTSQQVQAVVPTTQKVDVETIKTRAVTAAGAIVVGGFVGQDTGAIGVNASGHVSRVTTVDAVTALSTGAITAASFAAAAIDAAALAPSAGAEIADAVWDELLAGHLGAGSAGLALNNAGSAADPWAVALPGAYSAGTAGHIVGTALPDIAPGSANGLLRAGGNAATSITTALTANIIGNLTGNVSGSVGSVTADVGITQAGADKVWASAARTLTSFGTLVADVATAVWAAGTRTLSAFGFSVTVGTNNDKTGYRLSATGVDDIWDEVVDGTITAREAWRISNAANAGKSSGALTPTFILRNPADTLNRISASVDGDGNRTAVTLNLS